MTEAQGERVIELLDKIEDLLIKIDTRLAESGSKFYFEEISKELKEIKNKL